MKKPEPGEPVTIKIGDLELEVFFPLRALKELKTKHNIHILTGQGLMDVFGDPGQLATLVYYGLKTKQPDITQDWVEDNFDGRTALDSIRLVVFAATGQWTEDASLVPNGSSPTGNHSTGSPAGPSDAMILASRSMTFGT